jgi:hypothetical protein
VPSSPKLEREGRKSIDFGRDRAMGMRFDSEDCDECEDCESLGDCEEEGCESGKEEGDGTGTEEEGEDEGKEEEEGSIIMIFETLFCLKVRFELKLEEFSNDIVRRLSSVRV